MQPLNLSQWEGAIAFRIVVEQAAHCSLVTKAAASRRIASAAESPLVQHHQQSPSRSARPSLPASFGKTVYTLADAIREGALPVGTPEVAKWPSEAKLWLYRAGLGKPEIARLGAFFSPDMQRVVLPVYEALRPVFWQARAYQPGRTPKYISPPVDRTKVVPRYGAAEDVTLTEDILSAFKVGLVGEGWSMMGTAMNVGLIAKLMDRRPRRVNVWLDSDGPGTTASHKVLAKLRSLGIECRGITTYKDPKLNSRSTIKELLT